jgi:hypothetical protein
MKRRTSRKRKPIRAKTTAKKATKPKAKVSAKVQRKPPALGAAKPADVVDSLVAANAQALRLTLDPSWQGGIKFNLGLILRLAALVDEFPLPDDTEPGPVFYA